MEDQKRRLKRRRWKILALVGLPLILLILGPYLILDSITSARLRAALAKLDVTGKPYRLAELAPESPPPEQNAAQLWRQAWGMLDVPEWGDEDAQNEGGAWTRTLQERRVSEDDRAVIQAILDRNAPVIEMALRAMNRPKCVYAYDFSGFAYVDKAFEDFWGAVSLDALVSVWAMVHRSKELDSYAIRVSLSTSFAGQPIFVCKILRKDSLENLLADLKSRIEEGLPSDDKKVIREIVNHMEAEDFLHSELVLRRANILHLVMPLLDGRTSIEEICAYLPRTDQFLLRSPLGRPLLKGALARYLTIMDEVLSLPEQSGSSARDEARSRIRSAAEEYGPVVSSMLRGTVNTMMGARDLQANLAIARFALGLEDTPPIDPYDGRPIRYREEDDVRLIWSVGSDGVDDGGDDEEHDDIVWHVPR